MGRFIDINTLEIDKINYIVGNYSSYNTFEDEYEYFQYMGTIDPEIIIEKFVSTQDLDDIRSRALIQFSKRFDKNHVQRELINLQYNRASRDEYLKLIDGPTRLEFLTSVFIVQKLS